MTLAIVGNAPEVGDIGPRVDAADRVMRFNNANGWGACTGSRIDQLVLVNTGGAMREWLTEGDLFLAGPSAAADEIILPIHPDVANLFPPSDNPIGGDGENFAAAAASRARAAGKRTNLWPAALYADACALLEMGPIRHGMGAPSSGFLALLHSVRGEPPTTRIDVYGYGFAGWDGHPWAREKAWTLAQAATGRLNLHPLVK